MDFERQIDLDNVESRKRHATEGDEDSDEEEDEEEDEGDEDDEIDVASQRRPSDALLVPRGDLSQLLGPSVEQVFGDRGAARKRTKRRIKRRTGGTEGKVLPAEQTEKLREAAMKYVLGDAQGAMELYLDVTKHLPNHPDAFAAIARIHEDEGNVNLALDYYRAAARTSKLDPSYSIKVAILANELKTQAEGSQLSDEVEQYRDFAIQALRKVVKTPEHPHLSFLLVQLLIEKDRPKRAFLDMRRTFEEYPDELPLLVAYAELIVPVGRDRAHIAPADRDRARITLVTYLNSYLGSQWCELDNGHLEPSWTKVKPTSGAQLVCDPQVLNEAVHAMLLTLLDTKAAEDLRKGVRLVDSCLQLLECERKREHELDSVSAKWGLSIEVVGLYGVLLLKLKRTAAALRVFQTLLTEPEGSNSEDKSRRGRIILIIVPYLREAEWNALALKMLTRVKEHVAWREWPVREQARLWTLLGDVHDALNDFNNAIQAYLETLRLDTNSTSVMVTLSRLARTKRLDMLQHAFEITRMHVLFFLSVVTLETGSLSWDELQLEGNLLIELAQMCHQLEKVHDFLCVGLPIVRAWLAENVPARPRGAIRATYEMIKRRMEEVEADDPVMEHGMEVEQIKFNVLARVVCDLVRVDGELFEVMLGTVNCLCDVGRISAATDILRHALRSPCLTANQKAALSFDFQGMLNDDSARESCVTAFLTDPSSVALVNRCFRVFKGGDSEGSGIYNYTTLSTVLTAARLVKQHPNSLPCLVLIAQGFAGKNQVDDSLSKYLDALVVSRQGGDADPLVDLSLATHLLNMCLNKNLLHKHRIALDGMAIMQQYAHGRVKMWRKYQRDSALTESAVRQEVVYNIARGFHQLQLLHLAELYYRQALALWDDEIRGTTADKRCVHITYEAAHNLVLVYRKTRGPASRALCLEVMLKYLVIGDPTEPINT